jgi:hypothetical protein
MLSKIGKKKLMKEGLRGRSVASKHTLRSMLRISASSSITLERGGLKGT